MSTFRITTPTMAIFGSEVNEVEGDNASDAVADFLGQSYLAQDDSTIAASGFGAGQRTVGTWEQIR